MNAYAPNSLVVFHIFLFCWVSDIQECRCFLLCICNSKTLGCRQLFFQQSTLDKTLFDMV